MIRIYSYKVNSSCTQTGAETLKTIVNYEKMLKEDISKEKRKKTMNSFDYDNNNNNNNVDSNNISSNINCIEEVKNDDSNNSSNCKSSSSIALNIQAQFNLDKVKSIPLSLNELQLIKSSLKHNFLLNELSAPMLEQLINQLVVFCINEGEILYKEGYDGYFFFIVKTGKYKVITHTNNNNNTSNTSCNDNVIYSKGDCFGEDALLNMTTRQHTVQCIQSGELFLLNAKTFRDTVYTMNKLDYKERKDFLKLVHTFRYIEDSELDQVSGCLLKCDYIQGKTIARKGDNIDTIIIVLDGVLECIDDKGNIIMEIHSHEYIGEYFCIGDSKWKWNVITKHNVKCYILLNKDLEKTFGKDEWESKVIYALCKEAFERSKVFKYVLINVCNIFTDIVKEFKVKQYKPGNVIIHSSLSNNVDTKKIVILANGGIITMNKHKIASKDDIILEEWVTSPSKALPNDIVVSGVDNVITLEIALTKVITMMNSTLHKSKSFIHSNNMCMSMSICSVLSHSINTLHPIDELLDFYERLFHLKQLGIFKNISDKKLLQIGMLMSKRIYDKNVTVITMNAPVEYLYLLINGHISIYNANNKKIREYRDATCFGEVGLVKHTSHTATVITNTQSVVYLLSKQNFEAIVDNNMLTYIHNRIDLMDTANVELNDLYYIKKLGEGKFGQVYLVHDCKNVYAIKTVNKLLAQKKKMLTKYFIKERNVLLSLDFPFIIKLIKTFQNNDYVFYLMEYINGCEMSKILNNRDESALRNYNHTQFYIANILLVINYLHNKRIAHRDIKADNIMVDESGYLKLIDFNTCVEINDLTATIVGTPHYMAPELLLGQGYSFSVDYWSIGVLAYKVYFGYYPFGNGMSDPMDVYQDIVKKELFVASSANEAFSCFVKKLLNKQPLERLCKFDVIKSQKFFCNFEWDELLDKKLSSPVEPNYDTLIDKDELIRNKDMKFIDVLKQFDPTNITISSIGGISNANHINNITYERWADEF